MTLLALALLVGWMLGYFCAALMAAARIADLEADLNRALWALRRIATRDATPIRIDKMLIERPTPEAVAEIVLDSMRRHSLEAELERLRRG